MTIANSSATVSRCVFSACKDNGAQGGEALFLWNAPKVTITGCAFTGNGNDGTILRMENTVEPLCALTLTACSFTGNFSDGMIFYGGVSAITDCIVANNAGRGACLYLTFGTLVVTRCAFTGNHATSFKC